MSPTPPPTLSATAGLLLRVPKIHTWTLTLHAPSTPMHAPCVCVSTPVHTGTHSTHAQPVWARRRHRFFTRKPCELSPWAKHRCDTPLPARCAWLNYSLCPRQAVEQGRLWDWSETSVSRPRGSPYMRWTLCSPPWGARGGPSDVGLSVLWCVCSEPCADTCSDMSLKAVGTRSPVPGTRVAKCQ